MQLYSITSRTINVIAVKLLQHNYGFKYTLFDSECAIL